MDVGQAMGRLPHMPIEEALRSVCFSQRLLVPSVTPTTVCTCGFCLSPQENTQELGLG